MRRLFTSESVTEGHPDKICDQISDSILDDILSKDPQARVACEVAVNTGLVLVMGEISTSCYADIPKITRQTIKDIGYDRAKYGFDGETCGVITSIDEQSPDIALGVDRSYETKGGDEEDISTTGAGDQGMMFGYACNETDEYMPFSICVAHKLARQLTAMRKNGTLNFLRPDGKTQVTAEYDENGRIKRIDTIIVSTQHSEKVTQAQIQHDLEQFVIMPVCQNYPMDVDTKIFINPTGRFVTGGPQGDSGLTGRKIIVDTYGGYARHGGGAFSGKDPTKVDRSAAYMMRHIAKNIVAAKLADRCEIQVSYAIGIASPISVHIDTFGTGVLSDARIAEIVDREFDLRPAAIIQYLDLRRPIYRQTAAYGHFGRDDLALPWEALNRVDDLMRYL